MERKKIKLFKKAVPPKPEIPPTTAEKNFWARQMSEQMWGDCHYLFKDIYGKQEVTIVSAIVDGETLEVGVIYDLRDDFLGEPISIKVRGEEKVLRLQREGRGRIIENGTTILGREITFEEAKEWKEVTNFLEYYYPQQKAAAKSS